MAKFSCFDLDDLFEEDGDDVSFGEVVTTPSGEEIVPWGWQNEETAVRPASPALLQLCTIHTRPTVSMKKVG